MVHSDSLFSILILVIIAQAVDESIPTCTFSKQGELLMRAVSVLDPLVSLYSGRRRGPNLNIVETYSWTSHVEDILSEVQSEHPRRRDL